MNYLQITQAALSFADRSDSETVNNIDNFLRMVEAKIDRVLRVQQMEAADTVTVLAGEVSAQLPADFAEMREFTKFISYEPVIYQYVPQRTFFYAVDTNLKASDIIPAAAGIYTLIGSNTVGVLPKDDNVDVPYAFTYYKKVAPLVPDLPGNTNWVSEQYPDVYIAGLVYEISCFVKNPEAAKLWNERFVSALNELTEQNWLRKWPGASLVITLGD